MRPINRNYSVDVERAFDILICMVYFPEPKTPDLTAPDWDENPVAYYRRSTTPEAAAVRDFLNRTLTHFPDKHARSLVGKLRQDWQSFFFEIVVGRYLQVLGADIVPNAPGHNGTDVDYRATFPDGITISVECVSKKFNHDAQLEAKRHGNMTTMLDAVGPTNWVAIFHKMPAANSADEFQPYVDASARFYTTLPEPLAEGPRHEFHWEGEHGEISIEAMPFPQGTMANHIGVGVGWMDDSIERLRKALIDSHKRKQARGAMPPVFLAIDGQSMFGPDGDDFEQALFGSTVEHRGFDHNKVVGHSFRPEGMLVRDKEVPFAGVIAFLGMSMVGAGDPLLYLNPYKRWDLPAALAAHETRVWVSVVETTPAKREPVIGSIGFVEYPRE